MLLPKSFLNEAIKAIHKAQDLKECRRFQGFTFHVLHVPESMLFQGIACLLEAFDSESRWSSWRRQKIHLGKYLSRG